MPASWHELRDRLMTRVFYDFSPDDVDGSSDLMADGYLNSTSLLVVLGLLDDEIGEHAALGGLGVRDTSSLAAIQALYLRLLAAHPAGEAS